MPTSNFFMFFLEHNNIISVQIEKKELTIARADGQARHTGQDKDHLPHHRTR
jgi:hypothetical protein